MSSLKPSYRQIHRCLYEVGIPDTFLPFCLDKWGGIAYNRIELIYVGGEMNMAVTSQQKSGGSKKHGRNLVKCKRYRARGTRLKNKLARILRSNGLEAARKYRLAYARGERARV